MPISPFDPLPLPIDSLVAALPKADLHRHQEAEPRLDRLFSRRQGRPAFDWRTHAERVMATLPPGMPRLDGIYEPDAALNLRGALDADPELIIAMIADTLADG